jgi:anti-sigma B factor antagonist
MNYTTEERSGFTVLALQEKRLDARAANDFKKLIQSLIGQGHHNLLLDMGKVQFIDSSGLGAMVSSLKALGPDGDLQLCSINPAVQSLLKLTRLDRIFTIHESPERAL